jgi:Sulfotransferase domain
MTKKYPGDAWPDDAVWLASYPRSGNTYLRSILWHCFGLRSGSVYPDDLKGDLAVARHIGHYEAAAYALFSADFKRLPLMKTHEWPADDRKAIYVVRDGRASCRSLWAFLHASGDEFELATIIAGRHYFGSWSAHLLAWDPAARPNTLLLRFEDIVGDFDATLTRLASFLGVTPLRAVPPSPLPATGSGPHWLSPGSAAPRQMTSAEAALFDEIHGATMVRFGYRPAAAEPGSE